MACNSQEHARSTICSPRESFTDYKVILHGVVALQAFSNAVEGGQTHQESGFSDLDDLVFRFDGSDPEKAAFILHTHYREGYGKLINADLGSELKSALSLSKYFEAFLHFKRLLLNKGQKVQHVVLFTNRGVSDGLRLQLDEIEREALVFPLNLLLVMPSIDCQKFYKFRTPNQKLHSFYSEPRVGYGFVEWWVRRMGGDLKGLKLEFLKSLIFAVQQPDANQLLKIQADTISCMELCKTVSQDDIQLIIHLLNDSLRSWMETESGEDAKPWTRETTDACLREAKAKVTLILENESDGADAKAYEALLVHATLAGHVRGVEILSQGRNVNAIWREGRTLLHEATDRGYVDIVKVLLDRGCSADARETRNHHRAAIHIAVANGHLAIATLLLDHGCNPNLCIWMNQRPLHIAAKKGSVDMVRLLLEKGSDLNAVTVTGETALHCAVGDGHRDVAELLLDRGCDVNARSSRGNALFYATRGDHLGLVEWLLERGCTH